MLKEIRERNKMSIIQLAKTSGLSRDAIYKIENGKNIPNLKTIKKLANALKCRTTDLTGETRFDPDYKSVMIPIKYYDIKASAGTGCFVNLETFETVSIDELQLKKMGITSDFNNIVIINAQGNSMLPTIQDGDLLFININKKELYNDKIYIINEDNYLKVKRILKKSPFDTKVTIKSDNQVSGEYPPYEIDFEKMDKNFICGQVIFYCRSIE